VQLREILVSMKIVMMSSEIERISREVISMSAEVSSFGAVRQPLQKRKSKKDIWLVGKIQILINCCYNVKKTKKMFKARSFVC